MQVTYFKNQLLIITKHKLTVLPDLVSVDVIVKSIFGASGPFAISVDEACSAKHIILIFIQSYIHYIHVKHVTRSVAPGGNNLSFNREDGDPITE